VHPSGITIGSAALAGLTVVTDRSTDRQRYFVCGNRSHLLLYGDWRYGIVQPLVNVSCTRIQWHVWDTFACNVL